MTPGPRTATSPTDSTGSTEPSTSITRISTSGSGRPTVATCLPGGSSGVLTETRLPVSVIPYPTRTPGTSSR